MGVINLSFTFQYSSSPGPEEAKTDDTAFEKTVCDVFVLLSPTQNKDTSGLMRLIKWQGKDKDM